MRRILRTVQLVCLALLPGQSRPGTPPEPGDAGNPGRQETVAPVGGSSSSNGSPARAGSAPGEVRRCEPRDLRGGMAHLANSRGELRLLFPGCLAIAAPALLFRLKREGFSRCTVAASHEGLLVQGMR